MKWMLILTYLTTAYAGVITEDIESTETCDGVVVDNIYHDKEVLKDSLDKPYMLAVDNSSNILYFSYHVEGDEDIFKTAKIDLDDNKFTDLEVANGFAQTVDQKTRDVYIGTNDGIYKYNHKNDETEFLGQKGSDIWSIYYKDDLYFTEFPLQFLYTFINDSVVRFKDLEDTKIDHFIIDNEDTMFFTNATGLYSQKKGTKDAILYEEFPNNSPRGITIDSMGEVYLCLYDGIYKVDRIDTDLKKIADIPDCFGLAFDRDNNIIYSNSTSIVILKANDQKSC